MVLDCVVSVSKEFLPQTLRVMPRQMLTLKMLK